MLKEISFSFSLIDIDIDISAIWAAYIEEAIYW